MSLRAARIFPRVHVSKKTGRRHSVRRPVLISRRGKITPFGASCREKFSGNLGLDGFGSGDQQADRAAKLFDRRDSRLGGGGDFEVQFGRQFALPQNLHAVARLGDHAGAIAIRSSRVRSVELARLDRKLDAAEIDFIVIGREGFQKPPAWETTMQRHSAAFETLMATPVRAF